jgi:TolB-like protein
MCRNWKPILPILREILKPFDAIMEQRKFPSRFSLTIKSGSGFTWTSMSNIRHRSGIVPHLLNHDSMNLPLILKGVYATFKTCSALWLHTRIKRWKSTRHRGELVMMKRILCSIVFSVALISALLVQPAAAEFKKTKIAVLDFQLQGGKHDSADMGKIVAEWLITALVKEGRFDVIERRLLEKVLQEQKIGVSGLVDESSASKLGRVLGAKIVITGSVMEFQGVMEANARIIEVETSSIIAAENVKSTSAVKLEDLVVQMAEKIIRDFPLEGYIVQREGNKVLIDLGNRSGVKPGMQFIVYQEGRVIKHPKTGEVLDIERIETGTIQVKDVKNKTADGVILHESTPSAINNGQMVKSTVELVPQPAADRRRDRERDQPAFVSDGNLASQLATVNAQIEEMRKLKASGNSEWKNRYKAIDRSIDLLEKNFKKSPDVYLSRARSMEAIDKLGHAEKYIHKALSVSRHYPEAYALKGDIYMWDSLKADPEYNRKKDLKLAIDGYEDAAKYSMDKEFQASIYLKMGNAYADLVDDRKKAKEFWQKAVDAAPSSSAAKTAQDKLR